MLSIDATMPERGLDVSLRVTRGETVAILGPNGAGKSTLLGVLAGLVRPETGRAELGGRILFDVGGPGSRDPGHAAADAAMPRAAVPSLAGPGVGPSVAGPSGADRSSADPSSADRSAADRSAADRSAAHPSSAHPSSANPSAAVPSAAVPSAAVPSAADASAANASAANASAAHPSAAHPGAAVPSAVVPNVADLSAAVPSVADPSAAVPNVAVPGLADPSAAVPSHANPSTAAVGDESSSAAAPEAARDERAAPKVDRDERTALEKRPLPKRMPSRRERWLPAHARGVALLAQEPLLFPHLSAASNVAFGPRSSGAGRHEAHARALHWLHEVDATELADRRPTELSGGQAQRVAVARALAAEPQLLLLDEPLSALDVAAAPLLRRMLRRVLVDQTVLLVTHDVLDALTLADRVVVMHDGRIIEEGPTRDVLERPRTRFTADLAALNLITGTSTQTGVVTDADASVVLPRTAAAPAADIPIGAGPDTPAENRFGSGPDVPSEREPDIRFGRGPDTPSEREPDIAADTPSEREADIPIGTRVGVAVRPANVLVSLTAPHGPRLAVFPAIVRDLEPRGDVVRVRSDVLFADLTPRAIADLDLEPGIRAYFSFDSADAVVYPL